MMKRPSKREILQILHDERMAELREEMRESGKKIEAKKKKDDERNAILGRTSIGGGQSIFSDDLPVGFGNRQHIAAMNAMTLHDKAVADGYEGATPELEHFNADGSKRGGVGLYAHEKQPTYYNNPAPEGVHHPNYWAMHLYDQFHRGMPKDAEHISEA